MTPAEHYAEADRLLAQLGQVGGVDAVQAMYSVAKAQTHATLALYSQPVSQPATLPSTATYDHGPTRLGLTPPPQ